jgi:PBSX family phage terminase large subunit
MGAGKTVAALAKVVARAMRPKAFEVIARKYLHDCKATAIKQLLEGDGKTPALLPAGSYSHNKAERMIRLNEGGVIYYMGICNSDGSAARIGSLQATGIFVEQAEEIDEGAWQMLLGRIRSQADGLANQLYGVCNPGAPTHWLVERFKINHPHMRPDHAEYIPVTTYDNAHNLPPGYIDGLLTMDPWRKARYVFGEWVGATGVIYDNFRNDLHVVERVGPWICARIGVDDGHTNPTAMLLALQADDGRWHIAEEVYKPGMLLTEKKAAAQHLISRASSLRVPIIVDSAAAGLIAELRAEGLLVRGAHKEVNYGISVVRQRFNLLNGQPQLTISPKCGNLIRELNAYQWRDDHHDDSPLKENDHTPDALRYLLMDLHVVGNEEAAMTPIETHIANADVATVFAVRGRPGGVDPA